MSHRVDIPANLRRVARYLRGVEAVVPGEKHRRNLGICALWLERVANHVHRQEHKMGQFADAIGKLESKAASLAAENQHLKSQLADAQANQADSADVTAKDGVDPFIASLDRPAATTPAGAGGDTTVGGTGTDTTVTGAGNDTVTPGT